MRVYTLTDVECENVVRVLNVQMSKENDVCYIVMEKCDRDLLHALMDSADQRFTEQEAAWLFGQILNGLDHCHQKELFHGDIKPENLLLKGGVVKLTDFCSNSKSIGSSVYAAPERCGDFSCSEEPGNYSSLPSPPPPTSPSSSSSLTLSAAADVWSAGVTLFVMCAGYTPWRRPTASDKVD